MKTFLLALVLSGALLAGCVDTRVTGNRTSAYTTGAPVYVSPAQVQFLNVTTTCLDNSSFEFGYCQGLVAAYRDFGVNATCMTGFGKTIVQFSMTTPVSENFTGDVRDFACANKVNWK